MHGGSVHGMGHTWQGACVAGETATEVVVRILLERILVIMIGIGFGPFGVVFTVICVNKLIHVGVMIT